MNDVRFGLNGETVTYSGDPLKRLLDVLREDFHLTGAKEGCGEGECGACAVLLDGELVNSCLVPVGMVDGREILTPEGLADTARGRRIVEAMADAGAVQCGFCSPGMLMAAAFLLERNPTPSEAEIREAISGNLCRCTGYDQIVEGIKNAAKGETR